MADHRERLTAYKQERGCVDCGATEGLLDFDHRNGNTDKEFGVGRETQRPWKVILAEIEKCDIRCRTCHMKRHHRERLSGQQRQLLSALRRSQWLIVAEAAELRGSKIRAAQAALDRLKERGLAEQHLRMPHPAFWTITDAGCIVLEGVSQ